MKELGIELVFNDQYSHSEGMGDLLADGITLGWFSHPLSDNAIIKSFAWRPLNTLPDNPKFKYEKSNDELGWRPLLKQSAKPDDKPVFTQEMADRGEPIKNGQQFNRVGFDVGTNKVFYIVLHPTESDLHVVWEVTNLDHYVASYALTMSSIAPLDTRTPKQKAVDKMVADAICDDKDIMKSVIYVACEKLYDAGYRKTDKED
jgi:hypothetical protein